MGQLPTIILWCALYLVAPTFLIITGRLALAGTSMLLAAMLPIMLAWFGNIDNPAPPLMTMLMLPLPVVLLSWAALRGLARRLRRQRGPAL